MTARVGAASRTAAARIERNIRERRTESRRRSRRHRRLLDRERGAATRLPPLKRRGLRLHTPGATGNHRAPARALARLRGRRRRHCRQTRRCTGMISPRLRPTRKLLTIGRKPNFVAAPRRSSHTLLHREPRRIIRRLATSTARLRCRVPVLARGSKRHPMNSRRGTQWDSH